MTMPPPFLLFASASARVATIMIIRGQDQTWLLLLLTLLVLVLATGALPPADKARMSLLQRIAGLALALMRVPGTTEEWPVMVAAFAYALTSDGGVALGGLSEPVQVALLALGSACVLASTTAQPAAAGGLAKGLLTMDLAAAYSSASLATAAVLLLPIAAALGAKGGVRGAEWGAVPAQCLGAAEWLRPPHARLLVVVAGAALAVCARADAALELTLLVAHALARWLRLGRALARRGLFKQPQPPPSTHSYYHAAGAAQHQQA